MPSPPSRSTVASPVSLFGLAFKSGTDDLRESPFVMLAERLIGRGFDLRIFDRSVQVARLTGSNRAYIDREIPHLERLMVASPQEALASSRIAIIGHVDRQDRAALLAGLTDHMCSISPAFAELADTPASPIRVCIGDRTSPFAVRQPALSVPGQRRRQDPHVQHPAPHARRRFEIMLASPAPADTSPYSADIASVCDRFVAMAGRGAVSRPPLHGIVPIRCRSPWPSDRSAPGSAVVGGELAARPELFVVDFPHAAVLLPPGALPPSVIFTHNVEAEIFERHAAVATPMWRSMWRIQAARMRRFEDETLRRFNSVIAVSERDAAALRRDYALSSVERIDTGVDLDFHRFVPPSAPSPDNGGTIVFCGAMDWRANIDGIAWLMEEVWPRVLRARPAARAVIVGRNPPQTLIDAAAARGFAWQFTGYVDDVRPYVAAADVYVIPLRVGSGTRIKAFEAMATGRLVVSTTVGIEGLAIVPETHFFAADSAPDFAAAILRALDDSALRERITIAARTFAGATLFLGAGRDTV